MRRSDQPSRPSAMTCCFFSSLKTLLTSTEGNPSVGFNVLDVSSPLAGFQVTLIGRFWVTPEVQEKPRRSARAVGTEMKRGLDSLASVASTAPWIGIIGSVIGILNSFGGV